MARTSMEKTKGEQRWVVVDVTDKILGRVASQIALLLRGKDKATFVPHLNNGDGVIVVNARKVKLTGTKWTSKNYYRHTGYFGGLKSLTARELLEKTPERLIENAVWGMLPKTSLSRQLMRRLRVYPDAVHNQAAQKPGAATI